MYAKFRNDNSKFANSIGQCFDSGAGSLFAGKGTGAVDQNDLPCEKILESGNQI